MCPLSLLIVSAPSEEVAHTVEFFEDSIVALEFELWILCEEPGDRIGVSITRLGGC